VTVTVLKLESDVKETLAELNADADQYDGVIAVVIMKDGTHRIIGSTMSGYQKAFLVGFMNAWGQSLFNLVESE
jgi:hypothetical protein